MNVFQENAISLFADFIDQCFANEIRTIHEFASAEVILPNDGGPFEGQAFCIDNQPFVRLLWNELTDGVWSVYVVSGPTQSGKTLIAFVIPVLHIAVEMKTSCVVGIPDGNMVNDKWNEDFKPVLEASSSLAGLIPSKGAGSKGGSIKESVKLENGVTLRFMTRGGSDQSKAGFTARHVVVTEAAGWSKGTETSKEPNPFKQITGRQRSASRFDDEGELTKNRITIIEGTVTDENDLPLAGRDDSSNSVIKSQCVHCQAWVAPEREDFTGFEQAENELDAAKNGCFYCPGCGEAIDNEADRRTMVENSLLVHEGQEIKDGKVDGDKPKTSTMFFRWSAFHNLFVKMADIAAEEWKCLQIEDETPEREEAEKTLCQQVWAIPYTPPLLDYPQLVRKDVQRRREKLKPNVLPEDTDKVAIGVDVGLYICWWFMIVTRKNGTLYCPSYGGLDTSLTGPDKKRKKIHERNAIKACLGEMFSMFEDGFPFIGQTELRTPDQVFVDSNYHKLAVVEACKTMGKGHRAKYMPIIGVGRTKMDSRKYTEPKKLTNAIRMIGDRFYLEYVSGEYFWRVQLDADRAKLDLQACLRADMGTAGALSLSGASIQDHAKVSKHLASEVYKSWIENGEAKEEWFKTGQNHLLDSAAYGLTALKFLNYKIPHHIMPADHEGQGEPEAANEKTKATPKSWIEKQLELLNSNA